MRFSEESSVGLRRRGSSGAVSIPMVICVGISGLAAGILVAGFRIQSDSDSESTPSHSSAVSVADLDDKSDAGAFGITVRRPAGPPRVATGATNLHGEPLTVACSTCHSARLPNLENLRAADLSDAIHSSVRVSHGNISCLSCHNTEDYDALKLADGSRVEYQDVMTLCAQCHGAQMADFEHNVHGGMNGYWDLKRGPRQKNNCVDCHQPHAPAFPQMMPEFRPRDRFLDAAGDAQ